MMDEPTAGRTLLVGEGDFSFCVSMVNKLPAERHGTVTATSLETPDSIHKHQDALDNIEMLKAKGVSVKLETDATRLHQDPYFTGQKYARIIFNFPHAGGKSNHKKNRKLLRDFFTSASQILEDRGQVLMTLCKGQGGTLADRPRRAWHDSWQVVAMAADADLILVKVAPFHVEEYQTYSSTGFRSQDKGFNTENALTHIFERADRVKIPQTISSLISIGGSVFDCPRYLLNKMMAIRSVQQNSHHPLNKLYRRLLGYLSTKTEVSDQGVLKPLRPWRNDTGDTESSSDTETLHILSRVETTLDKICKVSVTESDTAEKSKGAIENFDNLVETDCKISDELDVKIYRPVCSKAELANIAANRILGGNGKEKLRVSVCPAFQKHQTFSCCKFTYCATIVRCLSHESLRIEDLGTLNKDIDQIGAAVKETLKTVTDFINSVSADMKLDIEMNELPDMSNTVEERSEMNHCAGRLCILRNNDAEKASCPESSIDSGTEKVDVGNIYVIILYRENVPVFNVVVVLDLAELCCISYRIADRRLLWSRDYRVLEMFEKLDHEIRNDKVVAEGPIADKPEESNRNEMSIKQSIGNIILNEESSANSNCTNRQDHCSKMSANSTASAASKVESKENETSDQNISSVHCNRVVSAYEIHRHLRLYCNELTICVCRGPSLYPLTNVHDMSFWENDTVAFDEAVYFSVIRDVACDSVISADLIDRFTDPATGRRSRCYRLTFQSVDQALSYDTTWKLQSMIRLEVEKSMKITLR